MKKTFMGIATLSILFFAACKKDSLEPTETEIQDMSVATEDLGNAESYLQTAEDESDEVVFLRGNTPAGTCPTLTWTTTRNTYPNQLTVDYGTTGCKGRSGRVRKGKIIINWSAAPTTTGSLRTVTFSNFSIDTVRLEGTRTWNNSGPNAQGQPSFKRTVNISLAYPDNSISTWESIHTVTQTEGAATPAWADNIYSIAGTESGTNRNGNRYKAVITSNLVHKVTCPWLVTGVRTFTNDSFLNPQTFSIDYGFSNNECDRQALLTLPTGTTRTILLRK
jgi:hypothetical protein